MTGTNPPVIFEVQGQWHAKRPSPVVLPIGEGRTSGDTVSVVQKHLPEALYFGLILLWCKIPVDFILAGYPLTPEPEATRKRKV